MHRTDKSELITSYLLGRLGKAEKEAFEEQYFTDDALFAELESMEHDLIEDYINGRLPEVQRKQFEKHYRSSPHRWKHVDFARAVAGPRERSRPSVARRRLAVAVAALLLIAMSGALIAVLFENRALESRVAELTAAAEQSRQLPQPPPTAMERFQLDASALTRDRAGGSDTIFRLRRGTAVVEIALVLPSADPNEVYAAVLYDADGMERASHSRLTLDSGGAMTRLTAVFPSAQLPQGSYVIRVRNSRGEIVESFPFGVRVE